MVEVRRGRARSEVTRRAILAATRDELTAHGYDRLSIDRIAAAAGAGKQTVYRWYPSKVALVADCLLADRVFDGVAPVADTGDLVADLRVWLRAFAAQFDRPDTAAFIRAATAAAAESDQVAIRFYEQSTAAAETALAERLRAGEAAGQLKPGVAAATAQSLIGAMLYRLLTRQPVTAEFADQLVSALPVR
ncbi:TetR/AcrR family transcriptional regulator [Actinoplanes couchii]|uniref:TetR family transcriptional regulator n=1 Tax=Actinoplanes couchii TaxID=403638 RepID=A0ABQ3XRB1_9ACTN|nr:TetR/AcrR family transcriptional regulator [Actinoplanes couchii]MDR6320008.1 AcrR family transcriptional regulator [Actinoplanes couchii]GID61047.1 TetR family transcriptional regulator [Actinoplanes couchii]